MPSLETALNDEISIAEVRKCVNMILDHLEKDLSIRKVKIPDDKVFYWDMNIDRLFDVRGGEPELNMGSTLDDVAFLRKMSEDPSATTRAPALMLMHLTPLLNLICDVVRA